MPALLFEPRFWAPIVHGDKVHSIRRERKRPICGGMELSLRGWEGKPYRSKQRILCDVTCLTVLPIRIDAHGVYIDNYGRIDEDDMDEFAKSDGFESWPEMQAYRDFSYGLPFVGDFIQWGEHALLRRMAAEMRR